MKNFLKSRRIAINLTQKQVADLVDLAESAYQRYERGERTPNVFMAIRIAKALNTTVEELFQIDD